MRKILIIIPARGGSKGIPRKNIRALNGKPLISYVINTSLNLTGYEVDCYVSSDDDEILTLSSKFGAKTIQRSSNLSDDKTTLDPVIYNAFLEIQKIEDKSYDLVITIQPTSPLLSSKSLSSAIQQLLDDSFDTVISGVYDSHLSWLKKDERFIPNYKERVNRQYLPEIYKETGSFVITKAEFVKENSRFGNNIAIYPLNKKEAIDIDTYEDWNLCDYYLNKQKILFVVTGYPEIGLGHIYNSLSIANEILNHRLVFLVDYKSELGYQKIVESNYEVHIQKQENIVDDIYEINPDIVISDILDTSSEYVESLKARNITTINFEDIGSGSDYADLVFNAMYPDKSPRENHYYGEKYFILRDEFRFTPIKKLKETVKTVSISFGGVDPNNYTERILNLIYEDCVATNININVVMGMGYQNENKIEGKFLKANFYHNIPNISDIINEADLIFTSAGRTTFEVASLGIPCIVLCQNKRETTHFFANEINGFCNMGLGTDVKDEEIIDLFNLLKGEYLLRSSMRERMLNANLKDGKENVLKLIRQLVNNN